MTLRRLPLLLAPLLLAACSADPQYATVEQAAQTYTENGPRLVNGIEIPAWNFVYYGLSKTSQQWFDENWEKICDRPAYREACGNQGLEKAKIVAFGGAIAPLGPPKFAKIEKIEEDGNTATVTFAKWDGEMHLVKEERGNWKIDGLFGIEEKPESQW